MPREQRREQLIDAALGVILEQGYSGVSIEAVANAAGVTRLVVYDHFPNLARLLHALVEREEIYALEQLEAIVPRDPGDRDPQQLLPQGVRRFLDAVASRPATWRIILLPLDGTPAIVRDYVESNRADMLARIEALVRWAIGRSELPGRARHRADRAGDPEPRRGGRADAAARSRGLLPGALRAVRLLRGHPRLAVAPVTEPLGLTADGLPVGVQVAAGIDRDRGRDRARARVRRLGAAGARVNGP
jgi:AcrR family transcriptional regulator